MICVSFPQDLVEALEIYKGQPVMVWTEGGVMHVKPMKSDFVDLVLEEK